MQTLDAREVVCYETMLIGLDVRYSSFRLCDKRQTFL